MIVLDTHIWLWFASNPELLSGKALAAIEGEIPHKAVYLSSISAWEIAMLVAKKRLKLTIPVEDWIARSEALPFVHFLPVDNHVAVKSVNLPEPLHDDPADRIIAATAMTMGATLITKDERLLQYPHVETLW